MKRHTTHDAKDAPDPGKAAKKIKKEAEEVPHTSKEELVSMKAVDGEENWSVLPSNATAEQNKKEEDFYQKLLELKKALPSQGSTSIMQHNQKGKVLYAYLAVVIRNYFTLDSDGKVAWGHFLDEKKDAPSESNPLVYKCRFGHCLDTVARSGDMGDQLVHIFKIPLSMFGTKEDTMMYNFRSAAVSLSHLFQYLPIRPEASIPHILAKYSEQKSPPSMETLATYMAKKTQEVDKANRLLQDFWNRSQQDNTACATDAFVWKERVVLNPAIAAANLHCLQKSREMLFPAANLPNLMANNPYVIATGDVLNLAGHSFDKKWQELQSERE